MQPHEEAEIFSRLATSIQDLEAFWGELDAAIGFKAQRYDGCGNAVFDSEAVHALHMSKRTSEHRFAVQRRTRIERLLHSITSDDRAVLALVFTPRRWEWSDSRSPDERKKMGERSAGEVALRVAFRFGQGCTCLLALALESEALHEAFVTNAAARAAGVTAPSALDLLHFLEWELAAKSPAVAKIRDAVEARLLVALAAFEQLRAADHETERAARARALDRIARLRAHSPSCSSSGV